MLIPPFALGGLVVDVLLGNLWRLLYHQGPIQDFF